MSVREGEIGTPGFGAISEIFETQELPTPVIVGAEIHTETQSGKHAEGSQQFGVGRIQFLPISTK